MPFVQASVTGFTRYDRVTGYFDRQERSGRASRHYKFTPGQSLPTGPLTVREGGALVGTVQLPATQAGRPVDLDLGADNELGYVRTVKQLAQEKSPAREGAEHDLPGDLRADKYQVHGGAGA